ncbi:DNA endonuclease SmrA [Shewanella sp. UCD-KL12]|uniref:DNA endonuclease SmrA n=1 Tax=Shewanella sp. UCD-KL12 TaxID=1917163 RepID=UPI000970291C|nr:DNA endonuclease SmrA [Shewanella sp. UCD-KL12]
MSDDVSSFLEEMEGVKPLGGQPKVLHQNSYQQTSAQLARNKAAQASALLLAMPVDPALISPVAPDEELSFCKEGVQGAVFRKLSSGQYQAKSELNLTGLNVKQAREAVFLFVQACIEKGDRSALIIHGKGYKSKPYPAVIKSFVAHWLSNTEGVLAFHSAKRDHGGTGALYLMLVKSKQKKIENSEINRKGSGTR